MTTPKRLDPLAPPPTPLPTRAHPIPARRFAALPLCWALTSLALFLGCSTEKQEPITSSQTHWLQKCEKSSECGDLECQCGVCTLPCSGDDACSELSDEATCAPTGNIAACGSGAASNVCLQGCDDGSCGSDSECVDGACVPVTSNGDEPPGVNCDDYVACDALSPCEGTTNCIAFAECGGGRCIDGDEACELSCPDPSECRLAESYPEQLFCAGKVPANPGSDDPTPEPDGGSSTDDSGPDEPDPNTDDPGPSDEPFICADYESCGVEGSTCPAGAECMSVGCDSAVCIDTDVICDLLCTSGTCAILESYPAQVACDGGSRKPVVPGPSEPGPADAGASDPSSDGGTTPSDPPGVACDEYPECDATTDACPVDSTCVSIDGCEAPLCISTDEACEMSCPDPTECAILESYPLQIQCPGKVPGSTSTTEPVIDLDDLNSNCVDEMCPEGLTPVKFFGVAGASGPEFCSCSIPCAEGPAVCPEGSSCVTIADGPGEVCVADEPTGPVCGNVTCADGERCCDSCVGACVSENSEILCPEDEPGDRICAGFTCGELTCAVGTQYCSSFTGGVAPSPTTYECVDVPEQCSGSPSCECLGFEGNGPEMCSADADGNVTVAVFAP